MNAFLPFSETLLLQWTLLLAFGWLIHWQARNRHPRGRLILWRSILCFGFILPLLNGLRVPRWPVPTPSFAVRNSAAIADPASVSPSEAQIVSQAASPSILGPAVIASQAIEPAPRPTFLQWLVVAWIAGFGWGALRLLAQQLHLGLLVRRAEPVDMLVENVAHRIQAEFGLVRRVRVRVVDGIASPFLCGVMRPTILLPRGFTDALPPAELEALFAHELAHQVRHDLAWCVAWHWMKAVCWFHPLVWRVPEMHLLACEEEADRLAADRDYDGFSYPQLLAQLALRVLRAPVDEPGAALHATSHLSRRLFQLARDQVAAWRPRHSLLALVGAVVLLMLTAGWQFARETDSVAVATKVPTHTVVVTVLDEHGKPVEGATITPDGLRAQRESLRGHFLWHPPAHGPVIKAATNAEGKAEVKYPVTLVAAEKILTGGLSFLVEHPQFSMVRPTEYPVDGTGMPVRLERGISIRVGGHFGPQREPVTEIVPFLMGEPRPPASEEWQRDEHGRLSWRQMASGKHKLLLTGRLATGEIVHSKCVSFFGEQRAAHEYDLEMKKGIRVEGRLDANVRRPVRKGWVQLSVHDETYIQAPRGGMHIPGGGNTGFWISHRPIAEDGSFTFESVPEGEVKVIAFGDGFISKSEPEPWLQYPTSSLPPELLRPPPRAVPQSFAGTAPVTKIEIATEATATIEVALEFDGDPVRDAKVHIWPNVTQMPFGSRLFAGPIPSSEAAFRTLPPLPPPSFTVSTNRAGVAVLRNVPSFTPRFTVEHSDLEVPLRGHSSVVEPDKPRRNYRAIDLKLSPGQTLKIEVALQPKGREFRGVN